MDCANISLEARLNQEFLKFDCEIKVGLSRPCIIGWWISTGVPARSSAAWVCRLGCGECGAAALPWGCALCPSALEAAFLPERVCVQAGREKRPTQDGSTEITPSGPHGRGRRRPPVTQEGGCEDDATQPCVTEVGPAQVRTHYYGTCQRCEAQVAPVVSLFCCKNETASTMKRKRPPPAGRLRRKPDSTNLNPKR